MTPFKTIRKTLVSAIFRQFGSCFGLFDTVEWTHYAYIFVKYESNLHSLRNRLEKLNKGSLFYLYLKLVQINFIFDDHVRIMYIYSDIKNIYCIE